MRSPFQRTRPVRRRSGSTRRLPPLGHLSTITALALVLGGCGSGSGSGSESPELGAADFDGGLTDADFPFGPGTDPEAMPIEPEPLIELPWGEYGPFDDLAETARTRYSGLNAPAVLGMRTGAAFADTLLFGPFAVEDPAVRDRPLGRVSPLELLSHRRRHEQSSDFFGEEEGTTIPCEAGGQRTIGTLAPDRNDRQALVTTIDYEGCDDGFSVIDGRLVTARVRGTSGVSYFGFENLTLTSGASSVTVWGAERAGGDELENVSECYERFGRTSTLLVHRKADGREILLDGLSTDLVALDDLCLYDHLVSRSDVGSVSGGLRLSDVGSVDVSTLSPFRSTAERLERWSSASPYEGAAVRAELEMRGAGDDRATFAYAPTGLSLALTDRGHVGTIAELTWPGDGGGAGDDPTSLGLSIGAVLDGALLDPDATDEVRLDPGRTVDESAEVSIASAVVDEVQTLAARVVVTRGVEYPRPVATIVELVLRGDARWDADALPTGCERSEMAPAKLRCAFDAWHDSKRRAFDVPILASTEGAIDVEVRAVSSTVERTPDDNVATASHAYRLAPPVDFALSAPGTVLGNADDVERMVTTVTQLRSAYRADVEVRASVPDGLVVEGAELLPSGGQSLVSRCTVGADVVCRMEDVRPGETLRLELDYLLVHEGEHELDWAVSSEAEDASAANDTATTRVRYVRSASALQALIDATPDGGSVTLPSGVFSGTLDGDWREIEVRGAEAPESTVLVSIDPERPLIRGAGSYSVWRNLELRTTGAPVATSTRTNASFVDNLVAPVEGLPHRMDELFDGGSSYRLEGNRFVGWGGGEDNSCGTLIDTGEGSQYGGDVHLRHNVFLRNDCERLLEIRSDWAVHVTNNTFVGNPRLVRILATHGGMSPRIDFRNNLVVGAESLLDVADGLYEEDRGVRLATARNIVRDSERPSILDGTLLSLPGVDVERTDLDVEPLFVDAAADDYRPAAGSPVIDAGVDPGPYRWAWTHEGRAADGDDWTNWRQPPAGSAREPVDGDGDGRAVFDIGAFEYRP